MPEGLPPPGGVEAAVSGGPGAPWDESVWRCTRGADGKIDAGGVLCVELGAGSLRAARPEPARRRAIEVRLGSGDERAMQNAVSFLDGVTTKRIDRWLSSADGGRACLPKGVVCGALPGKVAATVWSPTRLLGLTPGLEDEPEDASYDYRLCKEESRRCGVTMKLKLAEAEGDESTQLVLRVALGGEKAVELEAEVLVALLLVQAKMRSEEPNRETGMATDFFAHSLALAVPCWWADARRASAVTAAGQTKLGLVRLCSRPLCIAAVLSASELAALLPGLRRVAVDADADATKPSTDADAGVMRWRVLVLDVNAEGVEAAVVECEASTATGVVRSWRTVAAAGASLTADAAADACTLGAAAQRALHDGVRPAGGSLAAVILCGAAELTARGVRDALELALGDAGAIEALPCHRAGADAVAQGLALIIASNGALGAVDALPETIAVHPEYVSGGEESIQADEPDVLFERGVAVPTSVTRTYTRRCVGGDLHLSVVQRGPEATGAPWLPCLTMMEVLTTLNDDGDPAPCEVAVVRYSLDAGGVLSAFVEDVRGVPTPQSEVRRRRCRLGVFLVCILLGAAVVGYTSHAAHRRDGYRQRLIHFLKQHNPSRLPAIDGWLDSYAGTEDLLFRRLSKKYKAPFPSADDVAAAAARNEL
eukprot:NODE_1298_length_2531_cov_3.796173.p1 GENE.NODE_1298_length_2531_cov_3.796173~~NODE_1298_length_2531_cov_3.796173.p1  ORF type:complete len:689 (+),score=226.29 NODE_1298_length_2531_cov_3.796173:110-2068(+)